MTVAKLEEKVRKYNESGDVKFTEPSFYKICKRLREDSQIQKKEELEKDISAKLFYIQMLSH